jgi:hypothetical protein
MTDQQEDNRKFDLMLDLVCPGLGLLIAVILFNLVLLCLGGSA